MHPTGTALISSLKFACSFHFHFHIDRHNLWRTSVPDTFSVSITMRRNMSRESVGKPKIPVRIVKTVGH